MKLTGFAFGVRFTKGFHIEDQLGSIVDDILYHEDSKFNEKFFPELQRGEGVRRLIDRRKNNKLTINASDIIFEYVVEQDFKKELTLFLKEFEDNILKRILSTYKIKNIARIGFIIIAQLDSSDTLLSDVNVLVKKHYNENPDEALSLRFNIVKKQPLKIGKVTTEDYDNTIVTYDKANKEAAITFTVDYQKYFSPVLERIADSPISFSDFCGKCFSNYEKKYGKKEE